MILAVEALPQLNLFPPSKDFSGLPKGYDFLGIIPARNCNGACIYCDFGALHADSTTMDYDLAVTAVNWYAKRLKDQGRSIMKIHFFGGEPMMAPDIVEVVVHRSRLMADRLGLIPYFDISTNGQFTEQWVNFLCDYFNTVTLSFDGFADIQNRHRPLKGGKDSFEQCTKTASALSNSQARLSLRTCVSQLNVDQMPEIAEWFCREFNPSSICFETLKPIQGAIEAGIHPPDPYTFATSLVNTRKVTESYGINICLASDPKEKPVLTSCPVGKDVAIVTPDGRISSCYLQPEQWETVGLNLVIGNISQQKEVSIDSQAVQDIHEVICQKPRCNKCFCQWSCAGGCHVSETFPGCSEDYNHYCVQTRIITACSLLSEMGLDHDVDLLLNKKAALENLAQQSSDLLINNV